MTIIVLQSCDDEKFEVDMESVNCLGTIKDLLNYSSELEECGVIPLPNIDADTLRKLLEWTNHHKNDPVLKPDELDNEECSISSLTAFDAAFFTVGYEVLFKLLMAAKYLHIPGLVKMTAQKIADLMQGKTPQEIRDTFDIENDFSPEEEAKIFGESPFPTL